MTFTVHYQAETEPELERWDSQLPGTDPERRAMAKMYLSFIRDRLVEFRGEPPEAVRVPGILPPVFWWEFAPGWWMNYCVEDRTRWFRACERRVIVLAVQDEAPDLLRADR